ncbi:hypothetical protein ES705_28216 [subsurface metagenome]
MDNLNEILITIGIVVAVIYATYHIPALRTALR